MATRRFRDRIVRGASGELGYIAKAPGHGRETIELLEQKKIIDLEDAEAEKFRQQIRNDVTTNLFWNMSDSRVIKAEIERRAELAMKAYDGDLEKKRNRLRASMLNEESSLTAEYVNKAQQVAMKQFEHKQKLADEIQSRQVDRQTAFVQKCYEQIFKDNCDEFRTKSQRENRKALKEAHIRQIEERSLAAKLEKEEDQMWINEDGEMWNSDEVKTSQRENEWKLYTSALDAQIKDLQKRKRDEDFEERMDELKRLQTQKTEEALQQIREDDFKQRQSRFNEEFSKHLEWNRDARERIRKEEIAFDRIMIEDDRRKTESAQAAIVDNREQLKRELLAFQESIKQYKDLARTLEKSEDAVVEEQRKFIECRDRQESRNAAKKRRELLKSCLESRKKQMESFKLRDEAAKNKEALEAEFLRFRIEKKEPLDLSLVAPLENKEVRLINSQETAKENSESEKYVNLLRKRTDMEEQESVDNKKRKDLEIEERIEKLLTQSKGFSTDMHPFLRPLMCSKR